MCPLLRGPAMSPFEAIHDGQLTVDSIGVLAIADALSGGNAVDLASASIPFQCLGADVLLSVLGA